jgi:hypothetical protein
LGTALIVNLYALAQSKRCASSKGTEGTPIPALELNYAEEALKKDLASHDTFETVMPSGPPSIYRKEFLVCVAVPTSGRKWIAGFTYV